jgi:hypothetical protein
MSSHLNPGVYEPETLKIMVQAFDRCWNEFRHTSRNTAIVRNLMACAIVEAVEAGAVESNILVDKALRAVEAAILHQDARPAATEQIANLTPEYPRPRHTDKAALDFAENSTVVFPMPIDIIKPFLELFEKPGKAAGANGAASRVPLIEEAPAA